MPEQIKSTQKPDSQSIESGMKRDWTLIKLLLRHVERHVTSETLSHVGIPYPEVLNGFDDEQIAYHITLCEEAGFIVLNESIRHIRRLTWEGHNKLDDLRRKQ